MKALLFTGNSNASTSSSTYVAAINSPISASSDEVVNSNIARKSGVLTNLHVWVSVNGTTEVSTVTFRKNEANTDLVVSIGAGLTGLFEDNSNEASVVSGDLMSYRLSAGSANSITAQFFAVYISDTNKNVTSYFRSVSLSVAANNNTSHRDLVGDSGSTKISISGVFSNLSALVITNFRNTSTVFTFQKNNTDTDLEIAAPASTTGVFTDITNSVSISPNDTVRYKKVTGDTNSSTITSRCSIQFTNTNRSFFSVNSSNITAATTSRRRTLGASNSTNPTAVGATSFKSSFSGVVRNLGFTTNVNTRSSVTTVSFQKNYTNQSLEVSVPAETTGLFEDLSNEVSIEPGDLCNAFITFSAGSGDMDISGLYTEYQIDMEQGVSFRESQISGFDFSNSSRGAELNGGQFVLNVNQPEVGGVIRLEWVYDL